jgi:hypothetical protein
LTVCATWSEIALAFGRECWQALHASWRHHRLWRSRAAWSAINRIVYFTAFALIGIMIVSGVLLYTGRILDYDTAVRIHYLTACVFPVYILIHAFSQTKAGTIWKIFHPRVTHLKAFVVTLAVAFTVLAVSYGVDRTWFTELRAPHLDSAPILDGRADDPVWSQTTPVFIRTERGLNFENGQSRVLARAFHTGDRIYFLFQWTDPQRSMKHMPMVKTADGWKVMQSRFETLSDENDYFEDRFAVMLSTKPDVASGTIHLGHQLLAEQPRPATRGHHYTVDGSYLDIWLWKSARSNTLSSDGLLGEMDDDYFGPPLPAEPGKRYSGGYTMDPKTGGGYVEYYWTKIDTAKPLTETLVTPKFLPKDPALLAPYASADLNPDAGDSGLWNLRFSDMVPYQPELDTYPVGTVLPSVLIVGPFEGDRGGITARGEWQAGVWTLEVSRRLEAGSKYDVSIVPGTDLFLWVAPFNHTQTRHAQQLNPVRLVLD